MNVQTVVLWLFILALVVNCGATVWPNTAAGGHGAVGAAMFAAMCWIVGLILLAVVWTCGVAE